MEITPELRKLYEVTLMNGKKSHLYYIGDADGHQHFSTNPNAEPAKGGVAVQAIIRKV
jgi:hypothetical protein